MIIKENNATYNDCYYFFSQRRIAERKEAVWKLDANNRTENALHSLVIPKPFLEEPKTINDDKDVLDPRSIIKEFSLNTSTHGLPGIARSQSIYNCIFWSITFICFLGIMIYFVTTAILAYFQYPTQINVDIVSEWPQYFPAVSICNASPFRLDRFLGAFFNFTRALNVSTPTNATTIPAYMVPYMASFITDVMNRNATLTEYLYPLSSILMSCTYNSMICSTENFISFMSATYGLCYTFNAKMKNISSSDKLRYANENGGNGALSLQFYVHNYQYVPYFWNGKYVFTLSKYVFLLNFVQVMV